MKPNVYTRLGLSSALALVSLYASWGQSYDVPKEKAPISDEERLRRGDKLKAFKILPDIGIPVRSAIPDTLSYGTYRMLSPESRSLAMGYTGNVGSPWQSKIFFDRPRRGHDFVYLDGYQGMTFRPEEVLFYDTTLPFTFVNYAKNFNDASQQDVVQSTLSTNLGKAINLGVSLNYLSAQGYYTGDKSRNISYRLFGSYQSDRYDLWTYIANDYLRKSENAGISNIDYILNPDKYSNGRTSIESKDVPVYVGNDLLFNNVREGHAFLSHRYKLGYYKELDKSKQGEPSIITDGEGEQTPKKEFVPVGNISHQLYYNKGRRRFIAAGENDLWNTVFGSAAVTKTRTAEDGTETTYVLPNDTSELKTLKNTIALSLMEGFRPWVKFGLSAYLRTENHWIKRPLSPTSLAFETQSYFSSFVGGEIVRQSGRGLNFNAKAEFGIVGADLGAIHIDGKILTNFRLGKQTFGLEFDGLFENVRPAFFAQSQRGTYGWWDKNFDFSRRIELGAKAMLTSWGVTAEVRTASLQNLVYWDQNSEAQQHTSLEQIVMARALYQGGISIVRWDLEGAYQISSSQSILPLPSLAVRGNLFFDFALTKALKLQLGVEAYWHSAYYAPYYNPTNQQFALQEESRVGGDAPLLNAYANFKLKGVKFYLKMYNVGEALYSNNRLSLHRYTYNPMHLEAGLSVDLHN